MYIRTCLAAVMVMAAGLVAQDRSQVVPRVYLLSLEPPQNPHRADQATLVAGERVFRRQGCAGCHAPPGFTTGKLTLAEGYTPPADHPERENILQVSVGTDPGLALKTRKGTGFYKIHSLRGLWYRPALLHDGSVASLEEMFDPARLKPDHEPGGWKGPGVTRRAIPGHRFGLSLNPTDKAALIDFFAELAAVMSVATTARVDASDGHTGGLPNGFARIPAMASARWLERSALWNAVALVTGACLSLLIFRRFHINLTLLYDSLTPEVLPSDRLAMKGSIT